MEKSRNSVIFNKFLLCKNINFLIYLDYYVLFLFFFFQFLHFYNTKMFKWMLTLIRHVYDNCHLKYVFESYFKLEDTCFPYYWFFNLNLSKMEWANHFIQNRVILSHKCFLMVWFIISVKYELAICINLTHFQGEMGLWLALNDFFFPPKMYYKFCMTLMSHTDLFVNGIVCRYGL